MKIIIEKYQVVQIVGIFKLEEWILDLNLIKIENDKITVSNKARLYIRSIAMEFDPLMGTAIGTYSKTI